MISRFEQLIASIINELQCSPQEKEDIMLELQDHLYSAYEHYINDGITSEAAILLVLKNFGQKHVVSIQYQNAVNPIFGWMKKLCGLGFIAYSAIVLYKLFFIRLITRILEYNAADGPYSTFFVRSNYHSLENKQFFNFNMWEHNINLQPFKTILFYLTTDKVNPDIAVNNLVGNLILFIPLGLLLPLIFEKYKNISTLLITTFIISYSIELLQFTLQIGIADIDDIILYSLGALIGYFLSDLISHFIIRKYKLVHLIKLKF